MMKKSLSAKWCFLIAAALIVGKLILTYGQSVYLYAPWMAKIDDTLMLESAMSVSRGEWLGDYGYLTLSKHPFFSLWLSFLNTVGAPYLIAGQLLWAAVCGFCVYAFLPLIKQNLWRLGLFAILLYNPAVSAAKVQLRAYRDNIFPALCLLCVAGAIGAALRYNRKWLGYLVCLISCGIGLGLCYATREDGAWIAVFAVPAIFIIALYIVFDKEIKRKIYRASTLLIPFACTGLIILTICTINYKYYGEFILSDFTSGAFKNAYGAMTRIEHESWQAKVAVPRDVREKLYENIPEFKILKPLLESQPVLNGFATDDKTDLSTAGFYWALRLVAFDNGMYETPQKAREYWQTLADKINAYCDSGEVNALPKRSSTLSPFKAEYTLPVIGETFKNIGRILIFAEAEPAFDSITVGHGTKDLARYEQFLNEKSNSAAIDGTDKPYYSTKQKIAHFALAFVRAVYALLIPFAFVLALFWLFSALYKAIVQKNGKILMSALIAFGLLLAGVVRCGIVGYMFVSSFSDKVEKIMYLSSAHPLFIIFGFIGAYYFVQNLDLRKNKEKKIG